MNILGWIETVAKIVGIFGILIAAALAIWQARENLKQRKRELRWKQAEMGKKIMDEIYNDEQSRYAAYMIEPRKRRYKTRENLTEVITQPMVLAALEAEILGNEPGHIFIQDCFDDLFYYYDRIEQFLRSELVTFEDVERPTNYYVNLMANDKRVYLTYIKLIGYPDVLRFLDRFESWRDSEPKAQQDA